MKQKLLLILSFIVLVLFCKAQESEPTSDTIFGMLDQIPALKLYQNNWDAINVTYMNLIDSLIPNEISLDLILPSTAFFYPIKTDNKVISNYGPRNSSFHYGTDIKCQLADTIYAVFDGKVRIARSMHNYGKMVCIRHYNGLETVYGHLSTAFVKNNQDVKAGTPIGLAGRTGRATCVHLHLEIRLLGRSFDPKKIIDFNKKELLANVIIYKKKKRTFDYQMNIREMLNDPIPMLNPNTNYKVFQTP